MGVVISTHSTRPAGAKPPALLLLLLPLPLLSLGIKKIPRALARPQPQASKA